MITFEGIVSLLWPEELLISPTFNLNTSISVSSPTVALEWQLLQSSIRLRSSCFFTSTKGWI
ncbi:Uncharacterised protein [Vibrio cholerae]|nr:Uncharacterised protein [Vibrio cholerae]